MEIPLKNNPVGSKKSMERPGRDSMLYAWNNGKKEPVPEFEVKQSWTTPTYKLVTHGKVTHGKGTAV